MATKRATKTKRKRKAKERSVAKAKRQRTTTATDGRVLELPSEWYRREVAENLWMPETTMLSEVKRPKQPEHVTKSTRVRVPDSASDIEPLLTSWIDVVNFTDAPLPEQWKTGNIQEATRLAREKEAQAERERAANAPTQRQPRRRSAAQESKEPINSALKLRLYPTVDQRAKLDQLFATHRAVYNKLVARSREDCAARTNRETRMSVYALGKKHHEIATKSTMDKYFRNKKALRRHLAVNEDVYNGSFRDFKKAVDASSKAFWELLRRGKDTTFPELKFKSKFARSDSIELRARSLHSFSDGDQHYVRLHPQFFQFSASPGIRVCGQLPQLAHSVRLQRLRDGRYNLCIPRQRGFPRTESRRVCAIDPGVRKFATIYDPSGRTLSIKDSNLAIQKRFEAIDLMKSKLARKVNECKRHCASTQLRQRKKPRGRAKTKQHRQRYRLRRHICFANRRITRMVADVQHKLASWLARNYDEVLLPEFNTKDMAAKWEKRQAERSGAAAPPPTAPTQLPDAAARPGVRVRRQRKISKPVVRAMMAQSHYKFRTILEQKMSRAGGRLVMCHEEYTSKTCSSCGFLKENLGGSEVYRCGSCGVVLDRDVNAAKNILHKNLGKLRV